LIILESMASSQEAAGALEACKAFDHEIWLSFTLHGNRKNTLPSGEYLTDAIDAVSDYNFQAMLINCCATNQLTAAMKLLSQHTTLPFGGYANPERVHTFGDLIGLDTDPEGARKSSASSIDIPQYLADVKDWVELGATIVGGCCRTRPAHIQQIRQYLDTVA